LEKDKTTCFAATNCDRPLEELVSDMMMTLVGPENSMEDEDSSIFETTVFEYIEEVAAELGIGLGGVGITGQNNVGRRELEHRYSSRELKGWHRSIVINNITQRMLPSGSSALDVSMVITGDYRPPPFLDLNVIAEDSINRQGAKVVGTLRERGERAGREFFSRVEGIEAVAASDLTARPTRTPTGKPTPAPTGPPVSSAREDDYLCDILFYGGRVLDVLYPDPVVCFFVDSSESLNNFRPPLQVPNPVERQVASLRQNPLDLSINTS